MKKAYKNIRISRPALQFSAHVDFGKIDHLSLSTVVPRRRIRRTGKYFEPGEEPRINQERRKNRFFCFVRIGSIGKRGNSSTKTLRLNGATIGSQFESSKDASHSCLVRKGGHRTGKEVPTARTRTQESNQAAESDNVRTS